MKVSVFQFMAMFLLGLNALSGQTADSRQLDDGSQDLSDAPADRVLDFGEVFSADSASRKKLSRRLNALYDQYQFSVYYVAYSGIIGSNVSRKAAEFRDLWLGSEEEGLVFVCDTDMKTISYALTKVDSFPLDGTSPKWKLPDHDVTQAMLEMNKVDTSGMDEEEYLAAVGNNLVNALERRLAPSPESGKKGTLGILAAVVLAGGLISLSVWWIRRRSGAVAEEIEKSIFPSIEIPNRLGAHFGGGTVSEISFEPRQARSDS